MSWKNKNIKVYCDQKFYHYTNEKEFHEDMRIVNNGMQPHYDLDMVYINYIYGKTNSLLAFEPQQNQGCNFYLLCEVADKYDKNKSENLLHQQ